MYGLQVTCGLHLRIVGGSGSLLHHCPPPHLPSTNTLCFRPNFAQTLLDRSRPIDRWDLICCHISRPRDVLKVCGCKTHGAENRLCLWLSLRLYCTVCCPIKTKDSGGRKNNIIMVLNHSANLRVKGWKDNMMYSGCGCQGFWLIKKLRLPYIFNTCSDGKNKTDGGRNSV